jgi:hypothetical protein
MEFYRLIVRQSVVAMFAEAKNVFRFFRSLEEYVVSSPELERFSSRP